MKVVSVIGNTKTGKTTTIENIIRELKRRDYSVGTITEINFHGLKMDVEGTNTDKHRKAGAGTVTARGVDQTHVMYDRKLNISTLVSMYDEDFLIMEGVQDVSVPKIVTAEDEAGIELKLDQTCFAIAGRISGSIRSYKGLPVIDGTRDIERLVSLIEEKSADSNFETDSVAVEVKIGGKDLDVSPLLQKVLAERIHGILQELDGYMESGQVELCIRR